MSLPEPVTRTRFLVPEWVLFFGICLVSFFRDAVGHGGARRSGLRGQVSVQEA
jgi:hypothetical protein